MPYSCFNNHQTIENLSYKRWIKNIWEDLDLYTRRLHRWCSCNRGNMHKYVQICIKYVQIRIKQNNVYFPNKSNHNKSSKTKATFQSHVHRSLLRELHMCHGPPPRLLCIPGRFWVTVVVFHGCIGNVVLLQGLYEYCLKIILNPPFY